MTAETRLSWPELDLAAWEDARDTFHMWTQIVGKIRLELEPMVNHWWQVPLYVTSTGLTTSPMPYPTYSFQIDFDFCRHALVITTTDARRTEFALGPYSVAEFYRKIMSALRELEIEVPIWTTPVEVVDGIPFEQDNQHKSYDTDTVHRFW